MSHSTNEKAASPPAHVNESIDAVVDLHTRTEGDKTSHQRGVEWLASVLGRPRSLYVLASTVVLWVSYNVAAPVCRWPCFDAPPFPLLGVVISTVALTVTLIVLTVQNHQAATALKRTMLDLQIGMLSEKKATKIIELLEELRHDMPSVADRYDPEAREMSTALDPKVVAEAIEKMDVPEEEAPAADAPSEHTS